MSTMAALYLKRQEEIVARINLLEANNEVLRELQLWTNKFIVDRLKAPVLSANLKLQANQCAERYIFDEDAPAVTRELVKTKAIDDNLIFDSMKLPASNFWIEYPMGKGVDSSDILRIGLMVGFAPRNESIITNYRLMLAIVVETEISIAPIGLMTLPPDGLIKPGSSIVNIHWFMDHLANDSSLKEKKMDHDCRMFVYDLVDSLFLINTPRVCEIRESTFGSNRKVKAHDKAPLPLVEYKRLTLKVGVGAPRYRGGGNNSPTESTEARHKRLHRVVGHFRTYRAGREQPKVSFVPQHWRGDAELGILLHEREVKK